MFHILSEPVASASALTASLWWSVFVVTSGADSTQAAVQSRMTFLQFVRLREIRPHCRMGELDVGFHKKDDVAEAPTNEIARFSVSFLPFPCFFRLRRRILTFRPQVGRIPYKVR